jgi:hypothetical protein
MVRRSDRFGRDYSTAVPLLLAPLDGSRTPTLPSQFRENGGPMGNRQWTISTTTETTNIRNPVAAVAAQQRSNVSIEVSLPRALRNTKLAISVRNVNRRVS